MRHLLYSLHPTLGLVAYTSDPNSRGLFRQRVSENPADPILDPVLTRRGRPAITGNPVTTLVSPALLTHATRADFDAFVRSYATGDHLTSIHPNGGIPNPTTNP